MGREESVDPEVIRPYLHPKGRNMLYHSEDLGGGILRTQWFVQLSSTDNPEPIWLDIDESEISVVGTVVEVEATPNKRKRTVKSFNSEDV